MLLFVQGSHVKYNNFLNHIQTKHLELVTFDNMKEKYPLLTSLNASILSQLERDPNGKSVN